jgi:recombinational DNA repair protein RecT
MAKKTVFRRHSKWLPVSSEKMQEALEKDFDLPSDIVDMSRVGKPVVSEPKAIAAEPASASGELSEDEKAEIRKADADLKKRQEAAKQSREPGED